MAKQLGRVAALIVGALLALAAPAGAATIWTPVTSGTSQDITAIDYQSDSAAWFATANGQIFYTNAGAFTIGANLPGNSFSDIAFQPGGSVGYAVTINGHAFRSTNGGQNWAPVTLPTVKDGCTGGASDVPIPRLNAVVWADASTAYLVGGSDATEPVVLKTTNATTTSTFADVNYTGSACRLSLGGRYVTDGFAIPGNANALSFITSYFGEVWATSDGFASALAHPGDMINNYGNSPRLAVDPNNPNRLWAIDHAGSTCGSLCFEYSEAAGASNNAMTIVSPPDNLKENLYGVGFAGGTLVAAGDGGEIFTSIDGKNAYLQPAQGGFATTGWRSAGVADGTHAMVGGTAGALVKSTSANSIPTPPGSGPPIVPPPVHVGHSTLPANASSPTTKTSGGANITLYKRIKVGKGRYVPVKLSTRVARNFVIEILTPKRPYHHVSTLKTSLRKGSKTVHVKLPKRLKNGRYLIVVRVFKGRRGLGRSIKQAFIITS